MFSRLFSFSETRDDYVIIMFESFFLFSPPGFC